MGGFGSWADLDHGRIWARSPYLVAISGNFCEFARPIPWNAPKKGRFKVDGRR